MSSILSFAVSKELGANEVIALEHNLSELRSSDSRIASRAAESLANFPYEQVEDALIDNIRRILTNKNLNSSFGYVVTTSLNSLSQFSVSKSLPKFVELEEVFEQNKETPVAKKSAWHIEEGFEELRSACESRQGTLDKYTKSNKESSTSQKLKQGNTVSSKDNGTQSRREVSVDENLKTTMEYLKEIYGDNVPDNMTAFLDGLDKNHFDSTVKRLKATGSVPTYFGRNAEVENVIEALLREERGHVLLTGMAGVGKTTILKILQNGWVTGKYPYPGQSEGLTPPMIMELSIVDVTNPSDPSQIKAKVSVALQLAKVLRRHLILFVDEAHIATPMARNALKSFLTESTSSEENAVQFIWATTSNEAREFMADKAFSRRWTKVDVVEFTDEQAIEAVKIAYLDRWRARHSRNGIQFTDITQEAYETAIRYGSMEQPHAGNPTGLKELLEGAIIHKLRTLEKNADKLSEESKRFQINPQDIRDYLKFKFQLKLIPGDPQFDQEFEKIWDEFDRDYVGNSGMKQTLKENLKLYFSSFEPRKMFAFILFGPPGAGKSYLVEMINKHFFGIKDTLAMNGAEYSEGGHGLNKMIGSPTGTVGSEDQRSVLTKFMSNHREGAFVLEEADFAHQDVFNLFVNMISKKEFQDGLGQDWKTGKYLLFATSNVGQDLVIAKDKSSRLTWDDVKTRIKAIVSNTIVGGNSIPTVKDEILDQVFEQFIEKVSKDSNPNQDTSAALQNGEKLKRRFTPLYVLPPTEEDLLLAARAEVERYTKQIKSQYDVEFHIPMSVIESLVDLKNFKFEQGHTYITNQLDKKIFIHLNQLLHNRGQTFEVGLTTESTDFGKKSLSGNVLVVSNGEMTKRYSLGISVPPAANPWFHNPEMMTRIRQFPDLIGQKIMGQEEQISYMSSILREKALNWKTRVVFTQLGTSGNGKTEFGYSVAEVLFGSRKAAFKISGLSRWGDLNNYFRSDVGFVGSTDQTEFEKWFLSRKTAGGGVIILDELLSFKGLSQTEISEKLGVINKLYDLLDEGILKIGSKNYDASAFIIEITGNALQELFLHVDDSPEAEKTIRRILAGTSANDIVKYLTQIGLDAPKIARLGRIFLNGPLEKQASIAVAKKEIEKAVSEATEELRKLYDISVQIDPQIVNEIVNRVTTVRLGMRTVNAAIDLLIKRPISGILFDLIGTENISATLTEGKIHWYADKTEVVSTEQVNRKGVKEIAWKIKTEAAQAKDITPQLSQVATPPKITLSPLQVQMTAVHEVYGHWMVSYLLEGKNSFENISLIPSDSSLGHVSYLPNSSNYEDLTLTSWLRQMATLQAGHRAVFLSGIYMSGGGSGGVRSNRESASDDLGKVEEVLEAVLSNQILRDFHEFNDKTLNSDFKEFMRLLSKRMADQLIRYGKGTRLFEAIYEKTVSDRFLGADTIQELLSDQNLTVLPKPDLLLLWSVNSSLAGVLKTMQQRHHLSEARLSQLHSLAKEVIRKSHNEIQTKMKISGTAQGTDLDWIGSSYKEGLAKISQIFERRAEKKLTAFELRDFSHQAVRSCRAAHAK